MKIEAILKNIIFLDNGYFKYQEYQNLGIHSYAVYGHRQKFEIWRLTLPTRTSVKTPRLFQQP